MDVLPFTDIRSLYSSQGYQTTSFYLYSIALVNVSKETLNITIRRLIYDEKV